MLYSVAQPSTCCPIPFKSSIIISYTYRKVSYEATLHSNRGQNRTYVLFFDITINKTIELRKIYELYD